MHPPGYAGHAIVAGVRGRNVISLEPSRQGMGMTPDERAKRLRQALQGNFRIDLFSVVAERDFERLLADAIQAAERDALRGAGSRPAG